LRNTGFPVDPARLSSGLVHEHLQIFRGRFRLSNRAFHCSHRNFSDYPLAFMKNQVVSVLSLIFSGAGAFADSPGIAFWRTDAVWVANLDGSGAKKIVDGIFPAISPDGTRIAFTNVEKSGTSSSRHIAVAEIATG